jgi:hypothetical protein
MRAECCSNPRSHALDIAPKPNAAARHGQAQAWHATCSTERLVNARKLTRIPIRQVVRYHVLEIDGQKLEMARIGTTLASDLSPGGMFLTHTRLTPGVHVRFYFELPGGYVEAVGKVVHSQHRVDAVGVARPGSGVRFVGMSDGDRQKLDAYLGGDACSHRISEARV